MKNNFWREQDVDKVHNAQRKKNNALGCCNEFKHLADGEKSLVCSQEKEGKGGVEQTVAQVQKIVGAFAQLFVRTLAKQVYFTVFVQDVADNEYGNDAAAEVNDIGANGIHGLKDKKQCKYAVKYPGISKPVRGIYFSDSLFVTKEHEGYYQEE